MRILEDKVKIERAQREFEMAISSVAEEPPSRLADGGSSYRVPAAGSDDLWARFHHEESSKKHWNDFGLGEPGISPMLEVNSPVRGINRSYGGAFGVDQEGNRYLLHRGHFRLGKKNTIPMCSVWNKFSEKRIKAVDGTDCKSCVLVVGKLSDPSFVAHLREFVEAVLKLKEDWHERDDLIKRAKNFRGGDKESKEHKQLKEYVRDHPEILKLRRSPRSEDANVEQGLPSGDSVDVCFKSPQCWTAVEVKSARSDRADHARGVFQCVKYKAVMEAELASKGSHKNDCEVKAILVVEGTLDRVLRDLANTLRVCVREVPVGIYRT